MRSPRFTLSRIARISLSVPGHDDIDGAADGLGGRVAVEALRTTIPADDRPVIRLLRMASSLDMTMDASRDSSSFGLLAPGDIPLLLPGSRGSALHVKHRHARGAATAFPRPGIDTELQVAMPDFARWCARNAGLSSGWIISQSTGG
jgi:hypothetical protein